MNKEKTFIVGVVAALVIAVLALLVNLSGPSVSRESQLSLVTSGANFYQDDFSDQAGVDSLFNLAVSSGAVRLSGSTAATGLISPSSALGAGLVGLWTLDGSGQDTLGINNASVLGGPLYATGVFSSAIQLDGGGGQYLEVSNPRNLDDQQNFSLAVWIKTSRVDTNGGEIISRGDSYGLRVAPGGALECFFYNGSGWPNLLTTGLNVLDGRWHQVTCTKDASGLKIFADGQLQTQNGANAGIVYDQGSSLRFGRHGTGDGRYDYNGQLDEVAIWGRALSVAEVQSLAATGAPATSGYFVSKAISLSSLSGASLNTITPTLTGTNLSNLRLEISPDGARWCTLTPSQPYVAANCGLANGQFFYRVNFLASATLDNLRFDWTTMTAPPPPDPTSAFLSDPNYKGGFGRNATGGAGYPTYIVSSAVETGPGSLSAAFERVGSTSNYLLANKNLVFAVPLVNLPDDGADRYIGSNVTIDGLANGLNGVTWDMGGSGYRSPEIKTPASNIIIRGIRFQGCPPANAINCREDVDLVSLFGGGSNGGTIHDVLIDRSTFWQAADGALDLNGGPAGTIYNVTIQRSFFHGNSHALLNKYGTRYNISYLYNVMAHNGERNPQIVADAKNIDLVNNVVYQNDVTNYLNGDRVDPYSVRVWSCGVTCGSSPAGNVVANLVNNAYIGAGTALQLMESDGQSNDGVYLGGNYCNPTSNCPASSPRSTPNPIPSTAAAPAIVIDQLRTQLLPYVGVPSRNALEQSRLDEVASVLPGGGSIGAPRGADITPPTIAITSPAPGATVSGTITVSVNASDNVGVTSVGLEVDGNLLGTKTATPYTFILDTMTLANGAHTLTPMAQDAAGNQGSAPISVTVNNQSTVIPLGINAYSVVPLGTSATIAWTTTIPATGLVRYGTSATNLNQSVTATALATNQTITLTNLRPHTRYYYQISATANGVTVQTPQGQFRTKK